MVTEKQLAEFYSPSRDLIQKIFPELSCSDRELLRSGICGKCWDKLFPEVD